jgi:hypothetical protein
MSLGRRQLLVGGAGAAALTAAGLYQWQQASAQTRYVPLPEIARDQALRVVYAHNPRFEHTSAALLSDILEQTQGFCKAHFQLDLQFAPVIDMPIAQLFRGISPTDWAALQLQTLYVDATAGHMQEQRKRLINYLENQLSQDPAQLAASIAFTKPHLLASTEISDASTLASTLASALVDTQLERFAQWRALRGTDQQSVIDSSFYNEFIAWTQAPLRAPWPFEVVITNQLMASVEYEDNSLHSALRGGVNNGLTTPSAASRYGTVSVLSLFPMVNTSALAQELRGDSTTPTPVASAAAAVLTHELGHQLLHLAHPYANTACVMNPVQVLRFNDWLAQLNARACPLGNAPENTLGITHFRQPAVFIDGQ